ncbi:cytochrome c biogenesis protein CcdA, partial [Streptococcus sp. DD11]|uniref:cytochrome c biogenesis CcdA family protein n=1 Tax=Streptococcus sp. DD11 TaxID=1777879 RepID=UPI0024083F9A
MESGLFFISVFLAGILSFFSPCIFPLLPVYIGVLLDTDEPRTVKIAGRDFAWYGLVKTLCFIVGISAVFFVLGFGAGFLGSMIYDVTFRYAMGAV